MEGHNDTHVASIINWDICRHFGVPVENRWFQHHTDRLMVTENFTMIRDTAIPTARKIGANRPDFYFQKYEDKHLSS